MNNNLTPFENKVLNLVKHAGCWQSDNTDSVTLRNALARLEKRGLLTSELTEPGTIRIYTIPQNNTPEAVALVSRLMSFQGIDAETLASAAGRRPWNKERK